MPREPVRGAGDGGWGWPHDVGEDSLSEVVGHDEYTFAVPLLATAQDLLCFGVLYDEV